MTHFNARTAVVTGAASGIGKAITEHFEKKGWQVYPVDREAIDHPRFCRADVTDENSWRKIAERIEGECGTLDVLVNNAGILHRARLQDTTLEDWNRVLAVNLTGTFLGTRTLLPLLRKGNFPAILNMASIDALRGSLHHSAYAASKGGITSLTRALALELAGDSIRVNAICPGTTETPMVEALIRNVAKDCPDRIDLHPLKRISTVDDQAAAAVFLCSEDASFITGVSLSVDGGRAIR